MLNKYNSVSDNLKRKWERTKEIVDVVLGNKPGDIFTIGLSVATPYFVGFGFSFDRIVMPNGEVDWYLTGGGGLSTPGLYTPTIAIDRGRLRNENDPLDFQKEDIEGFSISSDLSLLFVGIEVTDGNVFAEDGNDELMGLKGGLRTGVGINLFGNGTVDL